MRLLYLLTHPLFVAASSLHFFYYKLKLQKNRIGQRDPDHHFQDAKYYIYFLATENYANLTKRNCLVRLIQPVSDSDTINMNTYFLFQTNAHSQQ